MDTPTLIVAELPELSDESAGQILDFIQAFSSAFEKRYYTQLRQYYLSHAVPTEIYDDDFVPDFDELPF